MDFFSFFSRWSLRLTFASPGAIDIASGIARIIRSELNIDGGKFRRLSGASKRIVGTEIFEVLDGRAARNLQRRVNRSGRYSIHSNPFRPEHLRQRLHEVHGGGLCLRIGIKLRNRIVSLL